MLITGSEDHTVAIWKLLKTPKEKEEWCLTSQSAGNTDLIATDAVLEGAELSYDNTLLLQQKGAKDVAITDKEAISINDSIPIGKKEV